MHKRELPLISERETPNKQHFDPFFFFSIHEEVARDLVEFRVDEAFERWQMKRVLRGSAIDADTSRESVAISLSGER